MIDVHWSRVLLLKASLQPHNSDGKIAHIHIALEGAFLLKAEK
jgi:hypothetical protein